VIVDGVIGKREDKMVPERKTKWFVRILIIALCLYLVALIGWRFFYLVPLGDLSIGVLVVLALVVVLVLSESFDSFSVGKLLTLSREVQRREVQVSELKRENTELRSQIVSVATTVSQHQSSTNILGLPETIARMFSVTAAADEEVREKQAEEQASASIPAPPERPPRTRIDRRRLEETAVARFLRLNNLEQFHVLREAKLQAPIEVLDPVSTSSPIFDAYLNTLDSEVFVEVIAGSRNMLFYRDRLYVMLSKLHHYRTVKKANVYLALVVVALPGDVERPGYVARLLNEFQPAVSNGLLRVMQLAFTEAEAASLYVTEPSI
jgi:hypothetical protein